MVPPFVFNGRDPIKIAPDGIFQPAAMGLAWIIVIAAWAIVMGVFEIITAVRLRKEITGEWALILGGVISVLFGLLVMFYPESGAFAIGFIVGIYVILFGILFILLALNLRKFKNTAVTRTYQFARCFEIISSERS